MWRYVDIHHIIVAMGSIGDSSAVLIDKVLPQHHTAVTLLGGLLAAPGENPVEWLDLACGKGQIISQMEKSVSEAELRARIGYHAYDIENEHTRIAEKIANTLHFRSVDVKIGEMEHFSKIYPEEQKFSFISFTNTVHELQPRLIANLLIQLLLRLGEHGILYIYDMETLPMPELGAVPWDGDDFKKLLATMLQDLGCPAVPLLVQRWQHTSCVGWSVNLQRANLQISNDAIKDRAEEVIAKAEQQIADILEYKLKNATEALEALTRYRSDNEEENKRKMKLLYEFWALDRALN
jgi:hypothetical protein